MKQLFIVLAITLLLPLTSLCQNSSDNAFAGENAIFIYSGAEPASDLFPDKLGNTMHYLQRRERAGSEWKTVASYHDPQGGIELMKNYQNALRLLKTREERFDPNQAWNKWLKFKLFDSLGRELNSLPAQMSFKILVADTTVQTGHIYQYRVTQAKTDTKKGEDPGSNWVAYPAKLNLKKPRFYKRRTELDAIDLEWYVTGRSLPPDFRVYRASLREKVFQYIKPDQVTMRHGDTVIYALKDQRTAVNELYRYFIRPVNAFGGGGNIASDTLNATNMDVKKLQTAQMIHAVQDTSAKSIRLSYTLPSPQFIGSVHVMRSEIFDKDFKEVGIASGRDTVFVDRRISPGKKYYYYLLMTDKLGRNGVRSIKTFGLLQERDNPFPARFVQARVIGHGVEVNWKNSPNKAVISGYYVCRREGQTGTYIRLSTLLPVKDTVNAYMDTSATLKTGRLYSYSVLSENLSNRLSKYSVPAYVTIQGIRHEAKWQTPRNVKGQIENHSVRIFWYDMRILNANQTFYNVYRKASGDKSFTLIYKNYPSTNTSFRDSSHLKPRQYVYAVEASDGNDKRSAQAVSNPVLISAPKTISPLISVFSSANGPLITWQPVEDKRVAYFLVYRYTRGQKAERIGRVNARDKTFLDKMTKSGTTYYYYLQSESTDPDAQVIPTREVYISF